MNQSRYKQFTLISLLVFLGYAQINCAGHYYINNIKDSKFQKEKRQKFENTARKKTGVLTTTTGQTIIVKNVIFDNDSTCFQISDQYKKRMKDIDIKWHQQNANKTFTFDNSQIKHIRYDSGYEGALEGLLLGTVSGLAIGNIYGRYYHAHEPYDEDPAPEEIIVGSFTILGGIVGLPVGTVIGALIKEKSYYYLNPKEDTEQHTPKKGDQNE